MSRTSRTRRTTNRTSALPSGLNLSQYEFCLNYLANGFNATAAYRSAYPGVTGACSNGCRLLRNAEIRAFLAQKLGDRWKALHMSGDEALGRVAMDARADPLTEKEFLMRSWAQDRARLLGTTAVLALRREPLKKVRGQRP